MRQLKIEEMEYLSELQSLKEKMDSYIQNTTNSYEKLYLKTIKTIISKEVFTKQIFSAGIKFNKNIFDDAFFEEYIEDIMLNHRVVNTVNKVELLLGDFRDYLYELDLNTPETDFLFTHFKYETNNTAEKEKFYHESFYNLVMSILERCDAFYSEYTPISTLYDILLGLYIKNDKGGLKARKHFFKLIEQTMGSEQFDIVEEENKETGYTEVIMLVFPN